MRIGLIAGLALALGSSALAQDKSPPIDPAKLNLARQAVEASGAGASFERTMKSLWPVVMKGWMHSLSGNEAVAFQQISGDVQSEFQAATPKILEVMAETYAADLTEQELKDWVAWLTSPSGRAMTAKNAQIAADAKSRSSAVMMAVLTDMPAKIADRICDVQHCTPTQRANIEIQARSGMQASANSPAP